MPLVSIILPTYNVEQFIAEALESCVQQSFRDIEIIVVDDCGSDNSIAIAKEYATKDSRIRIVHNKENFQLFAARAEGVKVAQGEYIMFLDPDDFLESNALQTCVDSMPQLRGGGRFSLL
ncbi:glycosyltransferase family 2 protein [uncultured Helicobacter sp.]|uniref:glycosyltransferase family 2 protein n=1 Tax=uncultured Helicobacter sp. TaxID=175537 RepID=UPI00374E46D9